MKRWVYIGLFVSVGLNLFLAGMIVAHLFVHGGPPHRRGGGPVNLRGALIALTPASQAKARAIWRENRPKLRLRIREIRTARRTVRALLREDTADIAKVEAALADVAKKREGIRTLLHQVLRKIAAALPPEERLKFYREALKRRRGRRGRPGHPRHPGQPRPDPPR